MPFGWGIVSTGKHPDIKIAPAISSLLTTEQRRLLPGSVAQYLDVRYLRQIRSSTSGGGGLP